MASVLFLHLSRTYQWNFTNKIQVPYIHKLSVSVKKTSFIKNVILPTEYHFSLQLIFVSLVLQYIFLMTFHGSIYLNIKLGPTTTSSPRRRGRGLHNPDSSHDQIRCFWLAEVRNFTIIMIEYTAYQDTGYCIGRTIANTLRPRQNGRHFADDVFKCIFLNGNLWILILIKSLFLRVKLSISQHWFR